MVKIIKLKAKTKLGQQKIRHHGDTFHVIISLKENWGRLLMDDDEHFEIVKETELRKVK
jgi:hypothetical protein